MEQIKKAWAWREGQKWFKQPRVWIIVAILLIIGVVYNIINPREETEVATADVADTTETEEVETEEDATATAIQSSVEMYCEDLFVIYQNAGYIASYIDVASIWNYWSSFNQLSDEYDSQGRPIYKFNWKAYNTITEGDVYVDCYVSSNEAGSNYLQQLEVDGVTVGGSEYYEIYTEDGELLRDSNGCYSDGSGNC